MVAVSHIKLSVFYNFKINKSVVFGLLDSKTSNLHDLLLIRISKICFSSHIWWDNAKSNMFLF